MMEIDILQQLFFSTEIYSYFGPLIFIVASIFIVQKERVTYLFFLVVESLITYQYFTLISSNGWFIWHAYLMLFAIIVGLGVALSK